MCPTSNVHSGAARSIAEHPVGVFPDLGFRVTINTDNRLMSGTTQSREIAQVALANGWNLGKIERVTVTAAESAFLPPDERRSLVETVIRPAFDRLARPAAES
jgi:adenosine deaminase